MNTGQIGMNEFLTVKHTQMTTVSYIDTGFKTGDMYQNRKTLNLMNLILK